MIVDGGRRFDWPLADGIILRQNSSGRCWRCDVRRLGSSAVDRNLEPGSLGATRLEANMVAVPAYQIPPSFDGEDGRSSGEAHSRPASNGQANRPS